MRRALGLLVIVMVARPLDGQSGGLRLRAAGRDTLVARATVTAVFTVSSQRDDTVHVTPSADVPQNWTVLTGAAPVTIAPRATEVVILSVAVPARTAAGAYSLRLSLGAECVPCVLDSVIVVVPQRRALDIGLLGRPGFVVSGKYYDAGFLIRNRGNVVTDVRLSARSSLGAAVISDTVLRLGAEASEVVTARVLAPLGLDAAADDVLEIVATVPGDSAAPVAASARVTVVPEPSRSIDEYLRVPVQIHVRAASSDGVSPFEAFGRGPIKDGSSMQVDFLARGPTGRYSAFGERDEYRLEVAAPRWRARVGDNLYIMSSLTAFAQPGFGAGGDVTRGMFTLGGYGQQLRRLQEKGSERGAFLSARPRSDTRLAVNVVDRAGGLLSGRIGSATAALNRGAYNGEVEVAQSQESESRGLAHSARVSGSGRVVSYDVGHLFANTAFVGNQRGSEHDYLTASTQYWNDVSFSVNTSTHRTDLSRSVGVPYNERFDVGTLAATVFERMTVEIGSVARATTIQGARADGQQRHVRARGDHDFTFGTLAMEGEVGRGRAPGAEPRPYSDLSMSGRHTLARGGFTVWADRYTGGSITKGIDGTVSFGGDASLRIARATDVTLMAYGTRVQSQLARWHSQIDAQISHVLPNGNSVTLRARLIGGGGTSNVSSSDQSVAYLEYGLPLRLPVSRLRTPGRVYGRVIDAVSGRGVAGALVRLGPQVAITDSRGQVAFGGVPGGAHRVSMSQETSFANAVFVGDPTLRVDSTRTQPTTFELAIARSARVDVSVRRFATARTSIAGAVDSLVDAGALGNATLVLAGERDTLFRTSDDNGVTFFTDVPPGRWIVTIRGDTPAYHRFDPDRVELTLEPGETKALRFRLVPRKREVQLIGDGQELRPTVADPKTSTSAPAIRTGKPNDRPRS